MSVEELNLLHRRYVQLSQRFRAAWVFHQFVQSLAKVYLDELADRYPAEFQSLYAELKDISQGLNASEAGRLPARLTAVEERLDELVDALLAEDSRVDPAVLRQFFSRFRSYDEKILIQLIRFYLYSRSGTVWEPDRLDKIDFLVTRLGEEDQENAGQTVVRDRKHLLEVFTSLHEMVKAGGGTAAPADLEQQQARIAGSRPTGTRAGRCTASSAADCSSWPRGLPPSRSSSAPPSRHGSRCRLSRSRAWAWACPTRRSG
jgi:hypothetical protein